MSSSYKILFLVLFGTITLGSVVPPPKLELVGTADGKTFYGQTVGPAGNGPVMNWAESQVYCRSFGMELGEILTVNQYKLLNETTEWAFVQIGMWTGAHSQMKWASSGEPTSSEFLNWKLHNNRTTSSCAWVWAGAKPVDFYIGSCDMHLGVLCQI